jgi:hypothetical protein
MKDESEQQILFMYAGTAYDCCVFLLNSKSIR